ncbi:carboxymuconolactone decarboxylase family protein [Desulfitobacterium sp.]|uniref:carboxymuconolactone decarboxylase family protein n=1 Tax=Desulfitobacterium sp. TaxID=49981 RepID=UPI002BEE2A9E|nr:carboxymuconolactone decarboxylase family protein [Desulfitobacterium sp.]HVJ48534.1 carboxymuconolactone decarboxylase family protein [Desulfitobacterium sp.]
MALPPFLKALEQNDPEFAQAIEKIVGLSMSEGALDPKTKMLIALALDAAHGADQGVASLALQARQMGVSDQEIAEALRLVYFASGNSILISSFAAFSQEG